MSESITIGFLGHTFDTGKLPLIGEGGTAWVYDISSKISGKVLKVFKPASTFPAGFEREQATERLRELKTRLENFPMLPPGIAGPEGMILSKDGSPAALILRKVSGFSLSQLFDYEWRVTHRFSDRKVRDVFACLAHTWRALHAKGIIIGDVKPENIIVENGKPILIDTEGIQFGSFMGRGYTPGYVDPLICKRTTKDGIQVSSKFSPETDWFGFGVMCFQALTFVHPYDGTYWKSKANGKALDEFERRQHGVSVYHSAVTVPRFARLVSVHKDLVEYFRGLFEHKHRKPFPVHVFEAGWSRIEPCTFQAVKGGIPDSAQL